MPHHPSVQLHQRKVNEMTSSNVKPFQTSNGESFTTADVRQECGCSSIRSTTANGEHIYNSVKRCSDHQTSSSPLQRDQLPEGYTFTGLTSQLRTGDYVMASVHGWTEVAAVSESGTITWANGGTESGYGDRYARPIHRPAANVTVTAPTPFHPTHVRNDGELVELTGWKDFRDENRVEYVTATGSYHESRWIQRDQLSPLHTPEALQHGHIGSWGNDLHKCRCGETFPTLELLKSHENGTIGSKLETEAPRYCWSCGDWNDHTARRSPGCPTPVDQLETETETDAPVNVDQLESDGYCSGCRCGLTTYPAGTLKCSHCSESDRRGYSAAAPAKSEAPEAVTRNLSFLGSW